VRAAARNAGVACRVRSRAVHQTGVSDVPLSSFTLSASLRLRKAKTVFNVCVCVCVFI
jgi:hypothetical protein